MPPSMEIEALAQRLQRLEDIEAIRNAIASYGPAADRGDCAAAASLWTADGAYDVGGMGVSRGPETIAQLLEGDTHQELIAGGAAHVLSPVAITLEGDRAAATGYSCVFRWDGAQFVVHRVSANRWELRRQGKRWAVTLRINRLLDGTQEAREVLSA